MNSNFYIYIMSSDSWTMYIGMTNDLLRRICEHREGSIPWFTAKYGCKRLVYYEWGNSSIGAIEREKELKKWSRKKKENLIKTINPHWKDLFYEIQ